MVRGASCRSRAAALCRGPLRGASKLVQFGDMKRSATTTPGRYLSDLPAGSYVRVSDLPGSPSAAKAAASRAARRGDISPVARGLYYKGHKTRYGTPTPPPEDVALEALRRMGVGPAGVSAARALGLTTQVPATPELAGVGRAPGGLHGVHLSKRNNLARLDLSYIEIALLETLRTWHTTVDGGWDTLVAAAGERIANGDVRPEIVRRVASREHHRGVKDGLNVLLDAVGNGRATAEPVPKSAPRMAAKVTVGTSKAMKTAATA
jgi:hypothetical protein